MKRPFCNCKKAPLFCKEKNKRIKKVKKKKSQENNPSVWNYLPRCCDLQLIQRICPQKQDCITGQIIHLKRVISAEISNCTHWQHMTCNETLKMQNTPAGYTEVQIKICISFLTHLIANFSGHGRVQGKDSLLGGCSSFFPSPSLQDYLFILPPSSTAIREAGASYHRG